MDFLQAVLYIFNNIFLKALILKSLFGDQSTDFWVVINYPTPWLKIGQNPAKICSNFAASSSRERHRLLLFERFEIHHDYFTVTQWPFGFRAHND
jgi:hypothetical protein